MITLSSLLSRRSAKVTLLATAAIAMIGAARITARADTPEQTTIALPAITVAADTQPPADGQRRFRRGPERGAERTMPERPAIDKKLSLDQVRDIVAGRLAMEGNANLKVGKVTTKEDGVATAEIVTKTGALVDARDISTRTGLPVEQERRFDRMRARFDRGAPNRGRRAERADGQKRDLALTVDQAKKLAEAQLIMRANPHLKVGAVKEKDADTITVDIVASDNSLVRQEVIDRHTGRPQRPYGMPRT